MNSRPSLRLLLLALLAMGVTATFANAASTTLVLGTKLRIGYDKIFQEQLAGLLPRELARQALLIAARDELGLKTRDQSLRESETVDGESIALLVTVDAGIKGDCRIDIYRGSFAKSQQPDLGEPVWTRTLKYEPGAIKSYPMLVPQFEKLARTEFVDLLIELGAKRIETREHAEINAEQLDAIDRGLANVDRVSQYLAVRRLHGLLSETGESPELLGRLANGYANLGLLTECGWNATSLVMKARAMLYAERLMVNHNDYLMGRWHWAYTQALTGIHYAALERLEEPLPEGVDVADLPSLPAWAEIIDPYCRYDVQELGNLADGGNPWASYLRMWCYYLADEQRKIDEDAASTVNSCPMAFNLYYLLAHEGSLGIMHRVTRASINSMYYTSAALMAKNDELPAAVQTAAATPATEKSPLVGWGEAISALRAETDDAEPSWQVLATLLEDAAATVATSNLRVARGGSTEQSMVPYVDLFLPALKEHPQRSYFESRKFSKKNEPDKITEVCQDLRFTDPTLWARNETSYVWNTRNSFGEPIGFDGYYGAARDFTAMGIFVNTQRSKLNEDFRLMLYRELKEVSPHSPMALVTEIKGKLTKASEVPPETLADWEQRAGFSSAAWHQLGAFYLRLRDYDNSCRCYETAYNLSPTYQTVRDWAWAFEYAKQLDKVVPTLKLYLEEEDHGLGHSNTHYEIARFYLRHNQPEEAHEHAIEAAQSWSARGLGIAAKACERLKRLDDAEKWYQALSNSYPSSSGKRWYLWRRRSGSEEPIDEPRKLAQQDLGYQDLQDGTASGWWPLAYYLFEDDLERAAQLVERRVTKDPGVYPDLFQLSIALQRNDEELVEQVKKRLQATANPEGEEGETWTARYMRAVLQLLDRELAQELTVESIDELLRDDEAAIRWCSAAYFISKFAESQDYPKWTAYYRDWAVSFHDHDLITWHLAASESDYLAETAEDSEDEESSEQESTEDGDTEAAKDGEVTQSDTDDAAEPVDAERSVSD